MRKTFIVLSALMLSFSAFSQKITDYKYVVVPAKFSFFKEENKYNLNGLTKMIFEKKGYTVLYDTDILPDDLANNKCKGLYANVIPDNTVFTTKIRMEVKNCKNETVFVSEEGTSRLKELEKAYIQAFRVVGKSVEDKFQIANPTEVPTVKETVVAQTETIKTTVTPAVTSSGQLFAQPIANGYQLIDSTPKIVLKIFKTSNTDLFIAKKDTIQGVLLKNNNTWSFEYYQNDKLVSEKMDIKF